MTNCEEDLIRRIRAGDSGAYAQLVDKYQEPLCHTFSKILGDSDAADDVTQQAFISAYEHLDRYDPARNFYSWLYRIALNGALNRLKRQKKQSRLNGLDFPSPEPMPDGRLEAQEQVWCVYEALAQIPYKYRVLLVLRHYLNYSYAEISDITNLPLSTVRSRLYAARKLMKDGLRERGMESPL